jgi:hypothetical protein
MMITGYRQQQKMSAVHVRTDGRELRGLMVRPYIRNPGSCTCMRLASIVSAALLMYSLLSSPG